jgi:hypothetical protein
MRLTGLAAAALSAATVFALALAEGAAEDTAPSAGDKAQYVGDKACQKCHFQQHKSWKKTGMAKAMKTLAPTTAADDKALFDKKTAAKLDPAKDYTTDATCLKCHTTGYGEAGGYPADPKKDDAAAKLATLTGSVSCEACHGPGSLYVKYKEPIVTKNNEEKKETTFTWEELSKVGLTKPDANACAKCHNKDNPTNATAGEFKFEEAKAKVHDHPAKK